MTENMLASVPGSMIILQNMVIFAKFVKFFIEITHAQLVMEKEHGLITQFSWKTIQKEDFSATKSHPLV